jgi:fatty acid synthase subunit alpha, fungi type
VSGITPGQLRDRISGATGQSQGVVSAVAIAASTSFESQEALLVLSLEPSIVDDAVEGGEGIPSPMLAVTGLALKDLEPVSVSPQAFQMPRKLLRSLMG